MSLVEKVLKNEIYTQFADSLSKEDRKLCDDYVRKMVEPYKTINEEISLELSDNDSRMAFLKDLLYLFNNVEGHKEWLEKP